MVISHDKLVGVFHAGARRKRFASADQSTPRNGNSTRRVVKKMSRIGYEVDRAERVQNDFTTGIGLWRPVWILDVILVAERAERRVQRQDEGIAAVVGVELGLAVALRIHGEPDARRPHVIEDLPHHVSSYTLLFPAHAEVERHVLAHLPCVVDERGVILAGTLRDAAIKPPAHLLQHYLLRCCKARHAHERAARASAGRQTSYVVRKNENELSIGHFPNDCWVRRRIPARVCPRGIELWNCKLPSRKCGAVVVMGKLPVVPNAQGMLRA